MSAMAKGGAELEREAARWFARRDRGLDAGEATSFQAWLAAAPEHAEALARVAGTWRRLAPLGARADEVPDPDLLAPRRPAWRVPAAVLALAAAVAVAFGLYRLHWAPLRYSAGEATARWVLPDGTLAELNRGAEIAVSRGSAGRTVELIRGEAHFTVARAAAKAFTVRAGDVAVRDLGTAFDVRREADLVSVLVTEGLVAVRCAGPETRVEAGQMARVRGGAVAVAAAAPADARRLLDWKGRRLVFANTPLAEAAAEMSLFNRRRLVVADADTGAVLVGGAFQADNEEAFVRLLAGAFGVSSELRGPDEIVLRKAR